MIKKSAAKGLDEPGFISKEVVKLIEDDRRYSGRTVNAIMTATYWEIGRRIVENEQKGKSRTLSGISKLSHEKYDARIICQAEETGQDRKYYGEVNG